MLMKAITDFIEFEEKVRKEKRGGKIMYDLKGQHKYLTLSQLYDHYKETHELFLGIGRYPEEVEKPCVHPERHEGCHPSECGSCKESKYNQ